MSRKFALITVTYVLLLVSVYSSLFTFVMSDKPKTVEVCLQRRDADNNAIALCCQTDLQVNGIPIVPNAKNISPDHYSDCKRCYADGTCVSSGKPSNKQVLDDSNITKFTKKNIIKDLDLAAKSGTTNSSNNTGVMKDGGLFKDGGLSTGSNNTANSTAMKAGIGHSPTGYCSVNSRTTCSPCDPGLPEGRYNCIPEEDWPENALPTFKN